MTSPLQSSTIDSLPKQFVAAMRTLFDIMDDKRTGLVDFADIERRWQDDGSKGLPKGVIESLRKVTPANGLLTFERFCAGLKICLLRNQVDQRNNNQNHQSQNTESAQVLVNHRASDSCSNRPPSAPILDVDLKPSWANTAAIRPNNVMAQQRTLSMPQLLANERKEAPDSAPKPVPNVNKPALYGPPKPPRTALGLEPRNMDRAEIRNALQNWQLGLMLSDQENSRGLLRTGRSLGDGKDEAQANMYQKKGNVRRREPRRHTLQNGIDYNMLKRMKQIEQEKDVLVQGLGAIEKARDWYLKQIAAVQDKMKYLGRMGHVVSLETLAAIKCWACSCCNDFLPFLQHIQGVGLL